MGLKNARTRKEVAWESPQNIQKWSYFQRENGSKKVSYPQKSRENYDLRREKTAAQK
jgi:hypothetical protein